MAVFDVNTLTTLSMHEEDGVVVALVREGLVSGLTNTDHQILQSALDTSGVPLVNTSPTGMSNLKLQSRTAELVPGDNTKVVVRLSYVNAGRTGYNFVFRGGTSLNQVRANVDYFGNQVYTTHTYPADHPTKPSETEVLGGEFTALAPQSTYSAEGIIQTYYPDAIVRSWVGYVNDDYWNGDQPGTWLCTHCEFEFHDITQSPPMVKFIFEFQYDATGWQPQILHNDNYTGQPPPNLVAGVGAKTVPWHPGKLYGLTFPL